MQWRRLGGLEVSAVGLGCATMTPFYDEPNRDAAIETLRRAREIGVDFLDSSEAYGQGRNEELIAHAVKGYRDICGPGLELDKKPGVDESRILVLGAGRSFHRAPGQG